MLWRRRFRWFCWTVLTTLAILCTFQKGLFSLRAMLINPIKTSKFQNSGFVVTLSYSDQQSAAAMGLLSQQCWFHSFHENMVIVEPFASDSYLMHNTTFWKNSEFSKPGLRGTELRFRDYFDLHTFTRHSVDRQMSLLVSWEDFLSYGPKNVIAVTVNFVDPKRHCLSFRDTCPALPKHPLDGIQKEAFWEGCEHNSAMKDALKYLNQRGFQVVRDVCFNCAPSKTECGLPPSLTAEEVHQRLFQGTDISNVTIILNEWYYRFNFRTTCKRSSNYCRSLTDTAHDAFIPSTVVQQKAKAFIQSVLKGHSFIALMTRIEWILAYSDMTQLQIMDTCIKDAINAVEEYKTMLEGRLLTQVELFVSMDHDKHGSKSFSKTIVKKTARLEQAKEIARYLNTQVERLHNQTDTYEQRLTKLSDVAGGVRDAGYVTQLQRTVVSNADCLVLVGGGNFQELALSYYIANHRGEKGVCVKLVCTGEKTFTFQKMLQVNR